MNDHNMTKQQLIQELATLRRQVVQMEEAQASRQQRDDALQESEELYTKLVDTIPDVVIRFDLEGNILFVNDYGLQISGYSREELEGRNMFMFIAPEDHGKVIENSILMMERRLGPKEYRLVMKDGRKIPFEVNGDVLRNQGGIPFGLVHVCRDITDRKRMEEELHASEEKYRLLVENAMIGIFWINDSFRFIYVNDHLCQILGCSKNELIGKDFREVLSDDSRDFVSDRYIRRQR